MKKYNNFFYNSLEKKSEDGSEDELDQEENNELDYGSENGSENGSESGSENGSENGSESGSEDDNEINIKISKLKIKTQENPQQEDNIFIEFSNDKNLEKIQEQYYNKIINLNKNVSVTFIIPENLIKTRVFTFFKCWRNGYCLNASKIKIPKNITKILFKKK